jgi:hypothetical protein
VLMWDELSAAIKSFLNDLTSIIIGKSFFVPYPNTAHGKIPR